MTSCKIASFTFMMFFTGNYVISKINKNFSYFSMLMCKKLTGFFLQIYLESYLCCHRDHTCNQAEPQSDRDMRHPIYSTYFD